MDFWRLAVTLCLLFFIGLPLCLPYVELVANRQAVFSASDDTPAPEPAIEEGVQLPRLVSLSWKTLVLILGTELLCLPIGFAGAVLLFRTDLPFRRLLTVAIVAALFIPIPVLTSGWQAAFTDATWIGWTLWAPRPGQPWAEGLLPAIWVHAHAALPWVILLMGFGLSLQPREFEESALLLMPAWQVLWRLVLVRSMNLLAIAALWIALQVYGEITVSDMFLVRTFSEEIYLIFSQGGPTALARAVAVSIPATLLAALVALAMLPVLGRTFRYSPGGGQRPYQYRLGRWRWLVFALLVGILLFVALPPLASLFYRAGLSGQPVHWSASTLIHGVWRTFTLDAETVYWSLVYAVAAGISASLLSLSICWCGLRSRRWMIAVAILLAVAAATPGPVVGLGLKSTIFLLLDRFPADWLAAWLYYGPSPLPMLWVHLFRALPFTTAMLWAATTSIPRELIESARLDGAGPVRELVFVLFPLCLPFFLVSCLIGTALSLGEISASKLVRTPGSETFTDVIFDRMHYGVSQDVAALCIVLLGILTLAVVEVCLRGIAMPAERNRRWI